MLYHCKRCGFCSHIKTHYIRHLEERKKPCKIKYLDIPIETLIKVVEDKKCIIPSQDVLNPSEYLNNLSQSNNIQYNNSNNNSDSSANIEMVDGKYQCFECKKLFKEVKYLDEHLKKSCKMLLNYNNIYQYNTKTFGNNKYGSGGGDIYIVQTDFVQNNIFKIGITTNLYRRMSEYRCGSVLEPRLHYYYPFKNIKQTDIDLKNILLKFNIKREIYKCDIEIIRKLIKEYQNKVNDEIIEIEPELKECNLAKCNHCSLCFYDNKSMFDHIKICENYKEFIKEQNSLECKYCKKVFKDKRYLQQHISRNNCKEKDKKEKLKQEKDSLKDEEIKLYKEEMALMRKQIELLMMAQKGRNTNIETQNNTTNNNTNNIITNI